VSDRFIPTGDESLHALKVFAAHHRDMLSRILLPRPRVDKDSGVVGILKQIID
jgi:hypothetical protein